MRINLGLEPGYLVQGSAPGAHRANIPPVLLKLSATTATTPFATGAKGPMLTRHKPSGVLTLTEMDNCQLRKL